MVPKGESRQGRKPPQRRRSRWRLVGQLAAASAGLVVGAGLLGLVWPASDPAARQEGADEAGLGPLPTRPITVLVIGTDADRIGAVANGAAPPGPANSDLLLLVRLDPKQQVQVLNLPTELAIKLPGQKGLLPLGAIYREGGVALASDVIAELLGLEKGQPDRYLVISRSGLRDLVNGLGSLELSPERTLRYEDKAQKYSIDLQGGLQLLNGQQVEQLVRFRDRAQGESGRRSRQQLVLAGLYQQLRQPGQAAQLPKLLRSLKGQTKTNLTDYEALSLLATALTQGQPLRFGNLPLTPISKPDQPLRQLARDASMPLWPAP